MDLKKRMEEFLADLIATTAEIPRHAIGPETDFAALGFDSRFVIAMNRALEQAFQRLPRTLFFEYTSVRELAGYFLEHYPEQLERLFSPQDALPAAISNTADELDKLARNLPRAVLAIDNARTESQAEPPAVDRSSGWGSRNGDIAIIGVSGRYPKAWDLEQFWRNLREGRDCIEPIPKDRWPAASSGRLHWGGFVDGVAEFDPLFFGISPREAQLLDPQERLFLETAWETVESAGYDPRSLARHGKRAKVGVFVGVMYGHYQLYGAELSLRGRPAAYSSSYASIANRVSYVLNLSGPSLAIDTMCSSSLTAIHLACASLRTGECVMALAGGVNVSIHPNKYRLLAEGKFLSSDGRCRSYGEGGDGYVPGEGVGAVLLKPLSAAQRDGDNVLAVIKGSAVNHGGRAPGYTVPSPESQAESLQLAIEQAGIDPATIGYIEGHGTGTSLGDPIEIRGLTKCLGPRTASQRKIPIGSVKSNIGHLESAAGIAGLTKVLLQLRARELVPSLHTVAPNPNIDFADAPVVVQRSIGPWEVAPDAPRRAMIASFGAGGSNAHLIVEEGRQRSFARSVSHEPRLFTLSARTPEQLAAYTDRFLDFLSRLSPADRTDEAELLYDICATLYMGRTPLDVRLAVVTESLQRLREQLAASRHGMREAWSVFSGQVETNRADGGQASAAGDLRDAARRWSVGGALDSAALFPHAWKRIPLPTYPFERRRVWGPSEDRLYVPAHAASTSNQGAVSSHSAMPDAGPDTVPRQPARGSEVQHGLEATSTVDLLRKIFARVLGMDASEVNPNKPFIDYGMDSVAAVEFAGKVNAALNVDISPTMFFEFTTIADFSRHLLDVRGVSHGTLAAEASAARTDVDHEPPPLREAQVPDVPGSHAGPLSLAALWERQERELVDVEIGPPATPQHLETHIISGLDGQKIEFATVGSGTPLVLISGLATPYDTWDREVLKLADRFQLIMINPPGAGQSEFPNGPLGMDFIVDQIACALDFLGVRGSIAVLGYSFGGLVAQAYVRRFMERVSALVLACTTSDATAIQDGYASAIREAQSQPKARAVIRRINAQKFPEYGRVCAEFSMTEELGGFHMPTLVLAGADDTYMPVSFAEKLARILPNATLRVVEGAGHFLGFTHPEIFAANVREFLTDLEGVSRPRAGAKATVRALQPVHRTTLDVLRDHIGKGEISDARTVSSLAAQVAYLLNRMLSGGPFPAINYNCFFAPSGIRAIDTALRFARQLGKQSKRSGDKFLLVDPDGSLHRHFDCVPGERIFTNLLFAQDERTLLSWLGREDLAAVYTTSSCDFDTVTEVVARCATRHIVSIVGETSATDEPCSRRLAERPGVVVFDEAIVGHELPFGVCAIREIERTGVWTSQPAEFAARSWDSGPVLAVVKEHILRRHGPLREDASVRRDLDEIARDGHVTWRTYRTYGNPGLAMALQAVGCVGRRYVSQPGTQVELERDDGSRVKAVDLFALASHSVRGHATTVAAAVVARHDGAIDYWTALEQRVRSKLRFDHVHPACDPITAVEVALQLGLLARRDRSAVVVFTGSPAFSILGALASPVAPGSMAEAVVEPCEWPGRIAIDPFHPNAASEFVSAVSQRDVGLVWLETLQTEWGGIRSVPNDVLDVINKYRSPAGYLVGVDETYSSLWCGQMFHSEGRLAHRDIVAVSSGYADAQLPAGYVFVTEAVHRRACDRNPTLISEIRKRYQFQLGVQSTLHLLDAIDREEIFPRLAETAKRMSGALAELVSDYDILLERWGEGGSWALRFNLEGWPRFVRDWFPTLVWAECVRDSVAPVEVVILPFQPGCVKLMPPLTISPQEIKTVMGTLRRVLDKGVEGVIASAAEYNERQGNARRAAFFRQLLDDRRPGAASGVA